MAAEAPRRPTERARTYTPRWASCVATLALLCSLALPAFASEPEPPMRMLMDFNAASEPVRWVAVNDGVMGGLSRGGPDIVDGTLLFTGVLSLANNGGFSSVRSVGRTFDLSDASHVVMRVRGDGRRYQLRLATDARRYGSDVSYGAEFATLAGSWIDVRVPLASLTPSMRGRALQGPAFDAADVREIGLLIGDKREGAFALAVDWIAVE
jgi:NADH dehydrogenase [ubiquinone] 1 alpha subcomplex assembly factor 1